MTTFDYANKRRSLSQQMGMAWTESRKQKQTSCCEHSVNLPSEADRFPSEQLAHEPGYCKLTACTSAAARARSSINPT